MAFMFLQLANIIQAKHGKTREYWQLNVKINHIVSCFVLSLYRIDYQQVTNTCHLTLRNGPF
jgi:hypothetical protein